jgi:DNA mismatch endonuclease (patch repair protein)
MTSWATTEAVRRSMQSNRPKDTKPEVRFRSALHAEGLRFRKHKRVVPGLRCEPDVVFPRIRLALFYDGCWWHFCPLHGELPRANRQWWAEKLAATRDRDARNDTALRLAGWTVLRIWQHEPLPEAVSRVVGEVTRLRAVSTGRDPRRERNG